MTESTTNQTTRPDGRPTLGVINRVFQALLRIEEVEAPAKVHLADSNGTTYGHVRTDAAGRLCDVVPQSANGASPVDPGLPHEDWVRACSDRFCSLAELTIDRNVHLTTEPVADDGNGSNDPAVAPLELLLDITASAVEWLRDHPVRLFESWADRSEAALLLVRPQKLGTTPLPLAERGFAGLPLSDLVPVCKAAFEMAQSRTFVSAGHPPRLITRNAGDVMWAAASSSRRMVLLRLDVGGSRSIDRARLISDAIRLIGEGEATQ